MPDPFINVMDSIPSGLWAGIEAGTDTTDLASYLASARAAALGRTHPRRLVFPSGVYHYSALPNFAVSDSEIIGEGDVRMRYTGAGPDGNLFDGYLSRSPSPARNCTNAVVRGFIFETIAGNGVTIRNMDHCEIRVRVASAGPGFAARMRRVQHPLHLLGGRGALVPRLPSTIRRASRREHPGRRRAELQQLRVADHRAPRLRLLLGQVDRE
jgi:hypothetical protein